jgi:hypothetical protein
VKSVIWVLTNGSVIGREVRGFNKKAHNVHALQAVNQHVKKPQQCAAESLALKGAQD